MSDITTFLESLSPTKKALGALLSAAGVGAAIALGSVTYFGLPEDVAALEKAVVANTEAIQHHAELPYHDGVEYVVCLVRLTLTDSTYTALEVDQRCPR